MAEVADRPWIDANIFEFLQKPPAAQSLLNSGIRFHGLLNQEDLLNGHHRPGVRPEHLPDEFALPQIDATSPYAHHPAPIDIKSRNPLDGCTNGIIAHNILGRLVDVDRLDAEIF